MREANNRMKTSLNTNTRNPNFENKNNNKNN